VFFFLLQIPEIADNLLPLSLPSLLSFFLCFFFFFLVLGIKLRALCLLGKHSASWVHSPSPFAFSLLFRQGLALLSRPAWDYDTPISTTQVAGTTDMYHYIQPSDHFFYMSFRAPKTYSSFLLGNYLRREFLYKEIILWGVFQH
jgi:hypothetical protein